MTHEASLTAVRTLGAMVLGALFILSAALASAQESTITFPVLKLGNCASKSACRTYCDDLANIKACVAFAESHGLMSAEEARQAREFERLGGKGPGGCTSKDSWEWFCEKPGNMRQCLDFAKQSGMMSAEELQEEEKVAARTAKTPQRRKSASLLPPKPASCRKRRPRCSGKRAARARAAVKAERANLTAKMSHTARRASPLQRNII